MVPCPAGGSGGGEAAEPRRKARHKGRAVHAETVPDWGPFYLTFSAAKNADRSPGIGGRWQAKCPYHKKNMKTACTRSITCTTEDAVDNGRRMVKWWALHARDYDRKRLHAKFPINLADIPDEDVLDMRAYMMPLPPLPDELLDDDLLDELDLGTEAPAPAPSTPSAGGGAASSSWD